MSRKQLGKWASGKLVPEYAGRAALALHLAIPVDAWDRAFVQASCAAVLS